MAVLVSVDAVRRVTLGARCLVGRSAIAHLRLDDPRASAEHATLYFKDQQWWLRDLASRNGTFIDGRRVLPEAPVALEEGAQLAFGSPEASWCVEALGPPKARAYRPHGGRVCASSDDTLFVPDVERPVATVFSDSGTWYLQQGDGAPRPVFDQERVMIGGDAWILELPPPAPARVATTEARESGASVRLAFAVSRDEEHVELRVRSGNVDVELGTRSHHYAVLLLARRRLEDMRSEALEASEWGWLYTRELAEMLGTTVEQANLAIWRARRQLKEAGLSEVASFIERRPRSGQLRLGPVDVSVERS